jgi:mannose-1-phosphate guanylyltransferase/phosphomannomutase
MVPLVNRPMLEHILLLLKRHGVTDVILTVQYMASYIQNQIGNGSDLGMTVTYSVEEHPLGTAGSVRQAAESLDDTFLVISGDALTDFNLKSIVEYHKQRKAMATLTLYRVSNPLEYGVVVTGEDGAIRQFQEKPSWSEVVSDTINTGIYVLEPAIFEFYERDQVFDFSKDLFPLLLKADKPLFGYVADGYWTDVGSIEEFVRASRDVLAGKVEIDWNAEQIDGVWKEAGAEVDRGAQIHGPVYLGRDVKIANGAVIHGPSVITDNTVVERRAHIDRSIIWRNTYVGQHSEVRGAVIGAECNIQPNTVVFENAVVSDHTILGRGSIIQPNVKIWPNKEVESGAVVSTSIIWGSAGRRVLFGRYGVSGLINVDFTPEMVTRLGSAYASTLPLGANVTVNRDLSIPSRMLKRALASGLPSAGANVVDLSAVPIPVARFYTSTSDATGGVHVRISSYDSAVIHIHFFNRHGMDLDKGTQRKVETSYFREDVRRAHLGDIGNTSYAPDVEQRYTEAFLKAVDSEVMRRYCYRLAVDYSLGSTSEILPHILQSLGCDVIGLNANQGLTRQLRSAPEYETAVEQLARIVPAVRFDLGVMLDVGGERLHLVDNAGNRIPQMKVLAALASLVFQQVEGAAVAVPVDAPGVFDVLAAKHGGKVVRTRLDGESIMAAAGQRGVRLAGDGRGRTIFPSLHPAFDAMFSLAKLLELLSISNARLHEVIAGLPEWHIRESNVPCTWDKKGSVMRMVSEQYRDRRARTTDGIKIQLEDEWVLVLPDPDEPRLHLVAEGRSDDEAQALVEKYGSIVTGLQR